MALTVGLAGIVAAGASDRAAFFLPLTGPLSEQGKAMRLAAEIALADARVSDQAPIDLMFFDHRGDPDTARALAQRTAAQSGWTLWLVGHPSVCSSQITAAATASGMPVIIVSSSADSLTMVPDRPIYRVAPPSSDYNDGLMSWMVSEMGPERRLAVVTDRRPVWAETAEDFRQDLESLWRGSVMWTWFDVGVVDWAGLLADVRSFRPTGLVFVGDVEDLVRLMLQCRKSDWVPPMVIAGSVSAVAESLTSWSDGTADGILAPTVWWHTQSGQAGRFVETYRNKTGAYPDYRAAEAAAAVVVAVEAVGRSRREGKPLATVLDEIDLDAPLGRVKFENFRGFFRQNRVQTLVLQLNNDVWEVVWPLERAQRKYLYPLPDWRYRTAEAQRTQREWLLAALLGIVALVLLYLTAKRRRELLSKLNE